MIAKTITFISEKAARVIQPHNDYLMITLQIANYNIYRVLIDTRSLVEVLFYSAYDHMGLSSTVFKLANASFYNFSSHSIQPCGEVKLLVMVGSHPTQATILTNFLIVDTPGVYDAIIRRPTLNAL